MALINRQTLVHVMVLLSSVPGHYKLAEELEKKNLKAILTQQAFI